MHDHPDDRPPAESTPPGPLEQAPAGFMAARDHRALLADVLRGVALGAHDERIIDWIAATWDSPTVVTITSLLARVRQAGARGPLGATGRPGTPPRSPREELAGRLRLAADQLAVCTALADTIGIDPPAEVIDLAGAATAWARRIDGRPDGA